MILKIIIMIVMVFLIGIDYNGLNISSTNNINQIYAQTSQGQDNGQ
jgi:hypothetical protein